MLQKILCSFLCCLWLVVVFTGCTVTESAPRAVQKTFSSPKIVSDDRWVLQGCPVSGPSLSVDSGGKLKVLWFAAGEGNAPGLYFAESTDRGHSFSPRQILSA